MASQRVLPLRSATALDSRGQEIPQDLQEILEWRDRVGQLREGWERRAMLNIERWDGTLGQHYWRADEVDDVMGLGYDTPEWRAEWMAPYLLSTTEQHAAMVATVPNIFYAEPQSDDADDRMAAEAATRVARFIRQAVRMLTLRREAVRFSDMVGGTFGKTSAIPIFQNGQQTGYRSHIQVVPAWECFTNPWAQSIEESPVFMHERPMHIEQVKMRWQGDAKAKRALGSINPDAFSMPELVRERLERSSGIVNGESLSDDDLKGIVLYREWYAQPTVDKPEGEFRVIVNDVEIYKGPLPYIAAGITIPFHYIGFLKKPGQFHHLGLIDIMWSTVQLIEALVNQGIEHNALTVWGKWFVHESIDIDGRLTTEPGEVIPFDANVIAKPAYFETPQPIPPTYMQFVEWLVLQLMELSGVREASRSEIPKRIESGVALAIAQEADKTRARMFHQDVDEWERALVADAIKLEQAYGGEERHAQIIGKNRVAQVRAFAAAKLSGPGAIDLVVKSSPSLSDNRAIKEMQVERRLELGIIDVDEARERLEELGPEDETVSARRANALLAEENFELLKDGEMVFVEDAWDHRTMWLKFKWIMATHEYLDLDEMTKYRVRQHFNELEFKMVSRMVSMQMVESGGAAGTTQNLLDTPQKVADSPRNGGPSRDDGSSGSPAGGRGAAGGGRGGRSSGRGNSAGGGAGRFPGGLDIGG